MHTIESIQLNQKQFDIQRDATNKFLNEISEQYKLHRGLLRVEGRNYLLCLIYDDNVIGTVMQGMRGDKDCYFLDTVFKPKDNAAEICGKVNARVEYEKAMERMSHNPLVVGEVFDIDSIPGSFVKHQESKNYTK